MNRARSFHRSVAALCCAAALIAALIAGGEALGVGPPLTPMKWTVEGVVREALVRFPEKDDPAHRPPVVFAFHGHGGTMAGSARNFRFHQIWPEAVVVYMQGLNTPGKLTDPDGKKPGWQQALGNQGDRDLKFFDAVLATLEKDIDVDRKRIYATGHSNGGGFTYLLWKTRPDVFAAMAPSAAVTKRPRELPPKPAILVMGEDDPLVKFEWQKAMLEALREVNKTGEVQPHGEMLIHYPSSIGAPLEAYMHPGTHTYPTEASNAIVQFFKEQVKP